ncbi:hypothetical protein HNV12_13950 [Methanococcoides sp. SA1]|nr:hypothetical protein [Methanococcoides sp. SA1]
MKFKYYDLLSHLVPGMVIYLATKLACNELLPDVSAIPLLAIAFVIGYFNNTISSWLENFYFFLSGGNPIDLFFNNKGIWKVKFYNGLTIKKKLLQKLDKTESDNTELFNIAMKIANSIDSSRLDDFNAVYAFSRSILTTVIISGSILIFSDPNNFLFYLTVFMLFIISLIRFRQRSGYYIREVLNIADNNID